MSSNWQCVPHPCEITKNYLQSLETSEHPLKIQTVTVTDSKGTRGNPRNSFASSSNGSSRTSSCVSLLAEPLALDGADPLSQFARQEQELKDPLTQIAAEYDSLHKKNKKLAKEDDSAATVLNWSSKRLGILNRFTTSEKLSITTSFLTSGAAGGNAIKSQTVVSDKVKFRLEQLDDFEDSSMSHMMDLTQQEYIQRIEQLNQELVQSWHSDQRVKALKIAIQCSKMLADTSVLQFYPSQFVLITDILDMFGKLVYERLSSKNRASKPGEPPTGKVSTDESARETCQNWFYKIASIRELLPRLYVEMSIIKCYEFLTQSEFDQVLIRLTRMIRGIGDPLVSVYARCYLVRVGMTITPINDYIRENFLDILDIYPTIFSGAVRSEINRQRLDLQCYLSLYGPALDFTLQALVHKSNIYAEEILQKCKEMKNNGPLLFAILNAFKPEYLAANALDFIKILSKSSSEGTSKAQLFRALGSCISNCAPLQEERSVFLEAAFHIIDSLNDPSEYLQCVETWSSFIAEYFSIAEVNRFLGNIRIRLIQGKAFEKHYSQLQSILYKLLQHYKETEQLLIQENFLPYLDLFHKESVKIEVCKYILTVYKQNCHNSTNDAIVTNALMYIGKILNDYVTALTVEDERRQISHLISHFIRQVNFDRDFERQLSFYVEARGNFSNLDAVYVTLVHAVIKLAMEARQNGDGKHKRKAAACIAYCFITIPSIATIQAQMDLYLLCGQVALLNLSLGQADACFEAALLIVPELPRAIEVDGKMKSLETYLVSLLCNMLATLVVVPDSPEQGVLYLLRLLLDAVSKFGFDRQGSGLTTVYLHALDMLYVQSLEDFPYHIPDVVSNDELYGHDPKFIAEVNNLCNHVVDQILGELKFLGSTQQFRTQATLGLGLFLRIVRYADLDSEQTFQLAMNLWLLAMKHERFLDARLIPRTMRSVEDTYLLLKNSHCSEERLKSIARLLTRMRSK